MFYYGLLEVVLVVPLAAIVTALGIWALPQPDGRVLAAYAPVLVLTGASTRWILLGTRRPGVIATRVGYSGGDALVEQDAARAMWT